MRRLIGGIVLVAVLLLGGEWALDTAFHPWAHAVLGWATLTGDWEASFVDAHGQKQSGVMRLRRTLTPSGANEDDASPLAGTLELCGGERYIVSGRPEWWRGRRFSVRLELTAPAKPRGYFLREARGEWSGDGMTLRARMVYFTEDGGQFHSGERFPMLAREIPLSLSRTQTGRAVCVPPRSGNQ